MQAIPDALAAILKSRFQAAASGFRARLETVEQVTIPEVPPGDPSVPTDPGNTGPMESWDCTGSYSLSFGPPTSGTNYGRVLLYREATYSYEYTCVHVNDRAVTIRLISGGDLRGSEAMGGTCGGGPPGIPLRTSASGSFTVPAGGGSQAIWYELLPFHTNYAGCSRNGVHVTAALTYVAGPDPRFEDLEEGSPEHVEEVTTSYDLIRADIDKSLRLTADTAEVELTNEDLFLGWGPTSVFETNRRCRIFEWYGEESNEIQVFEGLLDMPTDHRDVLSVTLNLRDMMALLIDQTFSATAPQEANEAGAVRTADNGVYLSMEVSAIVADMLDRVGWPADDREIADTSYVLDEFIIGDGSSYADAMIGDEQLTGLVGYSAWADEFGVFHFAPTLISQNLTDPEPPVYTFRAGEDIISLDDATDQYDLRTRVKARGPLTTTQRSDTWRELWRTKKITQPVGIWFDPTAPDYIRVVSRSTKRMYKLRQSDRVIVSSVYLGGHPLGLSGDPSDSSIYWVLHCPWIYTGSTTGNKVKKVRKSDHAVLATYSIPDGRWSAIKVSAAFMWLTNLDTDRFYKRDKADASAIANYQHTHAPQGVQANPSGLMVNGTKLHIFWANGGSTARFLVCDESSPTVIEKVVKTAGTTLHGGEFDTITDTECWGDSDSLNLVAKFTLIDETEVTTEVFAEVVDTELEDELGALAGVEPRVHDTHPGDDPHPFIIRRATLDLTVVTSLAQATETAQRQLDILSQRRRVLDAGIVGNPALQKTDLVAVIDPRTGLSETFAVDTYRSGMSGEEGTFIGTVALLPVEDIDDEPEDEGSSEGGDT